MPSQKSRRLKHIPDKLFDLITLPDSNDYTTYRDNELYPQFGGEVYLSDKWPDKLFGLDPNDVIKICVYGNNGGLIATEFMTHNEFESFINTSMTGEPAIVRLDPGAILRSLGYRRGRFTLKFEFMNIWKSHQEEEMFLQKGNALQDEKLSNFLRMLNVSIPHKCFDDINSYALLLIDQERNLVESGLNL